MSKMRRLLSELHSPHRPRTAPPPTPNPSPATPTPLQTSLGVPAAPLETPLSAPPASHRSGIPLTTLQLSQTSESRDGTASCCNVLSTDDSAYGSQEGSSVVSASQEESSVITDSTHRLTQSCSCPQLSVESIEHRLQISKSLHLISPPQSTPQLPTSSTPSLASSESRHDEFGQRNEGRPFKVVLEQRASGIGLLLEGSVMGAVAIKYLVSFGTAAKDGTLRIGDHLLEVNGRSVVGMSAEEVRSLLRWIPRKEKVTILAMAPPKDLTPLRSPFFTGRITITLKTSYFCPPGIVVEGGGDHHIQIASITPGSPANVCGRLRVGDELVEVNGHLMVGASLSEAMAVLQRHCLPMHLTVQCRTLSESTSHH